MSRKFNPVIVAGALLAIVGVAGLVGLTRGSSSADERTTKVVVASKAVAAGTSSAGAALVVKDLPARAVPQGAVSDPAAVSGQVALHALAPGEVVLPSTFGVQGSASTGGVVLPPGKEGLGVELAFAPGGLRYVVPGNKITVWATQKGSGSTRALLSNVLVIATTPGAGTGAATAVTAGPGTLDFLLALSRSEAAKVIGAQSSGAALYFTLADSKQGR